MAAQFETEIDEHTLSDSPAYDVDDNSLAAPLGNELPVSPSSSEPATLQSIPSTICEVCPPGIAIVEAGEHAMRYAVCKLLPSILCKFIFVVNNMTGYTLTRTDSVGGDSWPFSSIKRGECVAALYNQRTISSLAVEFTAVDPKPGVQTVVLYASWPTIGSRGIGIFAGKNAKLCSTHNIRFEKVHDHKWHGNKATICNQGNCYVYEYDLKELDFVQFAMAAHEGILDLAIENFRVYKGSLPGFVFIVNNLTGLDLTLEDDMVGKQWPLGDIKKGECAVGGFDETSMSLAAHYAARKAKPRPKSISLAGSWPVVGCRKIFFSPGKCAKYAWKTMKTSPYDDHNDNHAEIREIKEESSCVYYYEITTM